MYAKNQFIWLLVVLLLTPTLSEAIEPPILDRAGFVAPFDYAHVLCQSELPNNGIAMVSMSKPTNSFRPFGTVSIHSYDADLQHKWTVTLEGQHVISDITSDEQFIYVAGEAASSGHFGEFQLDSGDSFLAWLRHDGVVDDVQVLDQVEGYYARLHLTQNGTLLYSAFDNLVTFGGTVLMELTLSGEVIQSRSIPSITVSDICTMPNGEIALAGMLMHGDTIDGIEVNPNFGYVNFAALMTPNFQAQWFYVSEHVTFDDHHQIRALGENVLVFAPERDEISLVNPKLTLLNSRGDILAQHVAKTKKAFQIVQMEVVDNYVVVASDYHNYSNPNVRDTADISVYDSMLRVVDTHTLTGEFQSSQTVVQPVVISGNAETVSVGWLSDTNVVEIDGQEIIGDLEAGNLVLVTRLHMPGATSVGHVPMRQSLLYPNPTAPGTQLRFSNATHVGSSFSVTNVRGEIVHKGEIGAESELTLPLLPAGLYSVVVGGHAYTVVVE